jgi:hypothetical protein
MHTAQFHGKTVFHGAVVAGVFENGRARLGKVSLRRPATQRNPSTAGSHDAVNVQAMFTGFACWWDFFTKLFENRRARFGKVPLRRPATQRNPSTAGSHDAVTVQAMFTGFACWWDFFTKLFENRRARTRRV